MLLTVRGGRRRRVQSIPETEATPCTGNAKGASGAQDRRDGERNCRGESLHPALLHRVIILIRSANGMRCNRPRPWTGALRWSLDRLGASQTRVAVIKPIKPLQAPRAPPKHRQLPSQHWTQVSPGSERKTLAWAVRSHPLTAVTAAHPVAWNLAAGVICRGRGGCFDFASSWSNFQRPLPHPSPPSALRCGFALPQRRAPNLDNGTANQQHECVPISSSYYGARTTRRAMSKAAIKNQLTVHRRCAALGQSSRVARRPLLLGASPLWVAVHGHAVRKCDSRVAPL